MVHHDRFGDVLGRRDLSKGDNFVGSLPFDSSRQLLEQERGTVLVVLGDSVADGVGTYIGDTVSISAFLIKLIDCSDGTFDTASVV